MKLQFKDIIIPKYFTPPSEKKLKKCREAYERGELDRELVVDGKHTLRDGYVLYIVLKEHEYDGEVEVKSVGNQFYNRPTTYVFGKHMGGDDTERVWYINMSYDKVKNTVGRLADVDTKHGVQTITITRVERLSNPPYDGVIRKVVHI